MKLCLIPFVVALSNAIIIPPVEKQSIVERGLTSWGGWALLAATCPSGTTACGTTGSCCPTSYSCNTKGALPICCPTDADCSTNVEALNACADESWQLYSFGGYFCCTPDKTGTYSSSGRQCIANSLPIPTSIALTAVSQVTGTGGAGTATSPASTNGGQTTGTSSSVGLGSTSGSGSNSNSRTESVQGNQTVLSTGTTVPTTSNGPSSTSTSSKISSTAAIAIGALAAVVALLVAFIVWRFTRRRNTARQQHYNTPPSFGPETSQRAGEVYAPTAPYDPPFVTYKRPEPRRQELSGTSTPGPIYETGPSQHIELDSTNQR